VRNRPSAEAPQICLSHSTCSHSYSHHRLKMSITALPNDIFLLIIAYLSPKELILSRRVSKQFHDAFTEFELNRHALVQHYPRARELRHADQNDSADWPSLFAKVAGRYHHLKSGIPRSVKKLPLERTFIIPQWSQNYGVEPWQRDLKFEKKEAPFHYPDTLWTYEEGLLIFRPICNATRRMILILESYLRSILNRRRRSSGGYDYMREFSWSSGAKTVRITS